MCVCMYVCTVVGVVLTIGNGIRLKGKSVAVCTLQCLLSVGVEDNKVAIS